MSAPVSAALLEDCIPNSYSPRGSTPGVASNPRVGQLLGDRCPLYLRPFQINVKIGAKDLDKQVSNEDKQMVDKHRKDAITNHQGHPNHTGMPLHTP